MSVLTCPLCEGGNTTFFYRDHRRAYYECPLCRLIFVPAEAHLSPAAEKAEYDRHDNSPNDPRYRQFLSRLHDPLSKRLPAAARGLDFGSGPGPTLSLMFAAAGHEMAIYDKFYAPDASVFNRQYDFITATEVLEHLRAPAQEIERLWQCLRPGGILGIMTKLVVNRSRFAEWYYKNYPEHVCFFSAETFDWLAGELGGRVEHVGEGALLLLKTA